jgi:hypothetical protein
MCAFREHLARTVAGAFCGLGGAFLTEIPSCLAGPPADLGYHIIVASRGLPNQHLQLTRARLLRQPPRSIFG